MSTRILKNISMVLVSGLVLASAGTARAGDNLIIQKDKSFSVKELKVKKGDTITFRNDEKDITHNVFSLGPKNPFELKVQKPGESSQITVKQTGTTEVECAIHPTMKLKITVE